MYKRHSLVLFKVYLGARGRVWRCRSHSIKLAKKSDPPSSYAFAPSKCASISSSVFPFVSGRKKKAVMK
jgi:hypothetical protein